MKQAENNEIDALMRNLARRERAVPPARDSAAKGVHLDIDELSSYAERALPPSARARCTAHLADCDDCRKIVAQLSMAAGPLIVEDKVREDAVTRLTWIQKLATLFSPRMMRYAMPALALVVVAVAFWGWRQQRTNDYIALNQRAPEGAATKPFSEPTSATGPSDAINKTSDATKGSDQKEAKPQPSSQPAAAAPAAGDKAKSEGQVSDEKKPADVASSSTAPAKAGKQDAPAADKSGEQAAYAPEPPPPAAPKSQTAVVSQEQQKDLAKNNVADDRERGRDANVPRKGPARNDNEVASQRGPAKREAQPATRAKAAETGAGASAGERAEEDKDETRTISGRHFRRVGNAWVDTAYKSSMSIRSVTRGTEEYRALVADEPVIGSIVKQLAGEVIVVWKGHAYRIN